MNILEIYSTQKSLKRREQIPGIVKSILAGKYVEPILLSTCEDGNIQVENGHHRLSAYILSGRKTLDREEYILLDGETGRRRICKLIKLCDGSSIG